MVVGYLARSTSTTRNDQPGPEDETKNDETTSEHPEPNLGKGEFSSKTSELQISPLSSEKQNLEGAQNAERTPIFKNAFEFEDEESITPQEGRPTWQKDPQFFKVEKMQICLRGGAKYKIAYQKNAKTIDVSRNFDSGSQFGTQSNTTNGNEQQGRDEDGLGWAVKENLMV